MWRTCISLFLSRKMPPNLSVYKERHQSLTRRILAIKASRVGNEIMRLQGIMILLLPLLKSTMKWRGNKWKVYSGAWMSRGSLHMRKDSCRHLCGEINRFMQPRGRQPILMVAQLGCRTTHNFTKNRNNKSSKDTTIREGTDQHHSLCGWGLRRVRGRIRLTWAHLHPLLCLHIIPAAFTAVSPEGRWISGKNTSFYYSNQPSSCFACRCSLNCV